RLHLREPRHPHRSGPPESRQNPGAGGPHRLHWRRWDLRWDFYDRAPGRLIGVTTACSRLSLAFLSLKVPQGFLCMLRAFYRISFFCLLHRHLQVFDPLLDMGFVLFFLRLLRILQRRFSMLPELIRLTGLPLFYRLFGVRDCLCFLLFLFFFCHLVSPSFTIVESTYPPFTPNTR